MTDDEMKKKFTAIAESLRPMLDDMVKLVREQTGAPGIRLELGHTDIEGEGVLEINVRTNMNPASSPQAREMIDLLKKLAEQHGVRINPDAVKPQDRPKEKKPEPEVELLPDVMLKFLNNLGKGEGEAGNA
jgi:hypothetical protein